MSVGLGLGDVEEEIASRHSLSRRLDAYRRLDYVLRFTWECASGIPDCDGKAHPGHPYAHARPHQLPPQDDSWYVWALVTGRGYGKTRSAAEYVKKRMLEEPGLRAAIVVPDFAVGRDVCIEGESGLRGLVEDQGVIPWSKIRSWNRTNGELTLHNGSQAKIFGTNSEQDANKPRGYQPGVVWWEELATQRYGETAWGAMEFGVRGSASPKMVVTSTPRRIPIVKRLLTEAEDPASGTVVVRGSLYENADNLPASFVERMRRRYEGTSFGAQELYGELLAEVEGAHWNQGMIEQGRISLGELPDMDRIVVAIDPAVTSGVNSDESGIVVVGRQGRAEDAEFFVLEDATGRYSPDEVVQRALKLLDDWEADEIVAEVNNGGDWIGKAVRDARRSVSYRQVRATRGKIIRAQPVVGLYEQGRVHHVGRFADLETQMTSFIPGDRWSPDRMDALVWGVTSLTDSKAPRRILSAGLA